MAYLGTTAASSVSNPPIKLAGSMAGMDQRIPGTGTTGSTIYVNNAYRMGSTVSYAEGRAFGGQFWGYWSTDNTTGVYASGFIADGGQLGMRPGDVVMIVGNASTVGSSNVLRFATVATISSAGAATLSTVEITKSS